MKTKINFLNAQEVLLFIKNSFADEPQRLQHILAVADRVKQSAELLTLNINLAYCAALLHDVGYIPALKKTGFHPIDGARFLEDNGYKEISELIICHGNSPEQAAIKNLEKIEISDNLIAKLITYWDVQTKQGGTLVSYQERLADIIKRHGHDSPVTIAHAHSKERILKILDEVSNLLKLSKKLSP